MIKLLQAAYNSRPLHGTFKKNGKFAPLNTFSGTFARRRVSGL